MLASVHLVLVFRHKKHRLAGSYNIASGYLRTKKRKKVGAFVQFSPLPKYLIVQATDYWIKVCYKPVGTLLGFLLPSWSTKS